MGNMNTIGDRIRAARLARKWSAAELAKRAGYRTQSGISNLENRGTGTGGHKISHLASVLGVTTDWLLNGGDMQFVESIPHYGDAFNQTAQVNEPQAIYKFSTTTDDPRTKRLLSLWSHLDDQGKDELLGRIEFFVAGRNPHTHGNALQTAG